MSVIAGSRTIFSDSLPNTFNLDLANTIMDEHPVAYIGFDVNIKWHEKFNTNLKLLVVDSYVINNITLSAQYSTSPFLGISAGYYSFDYFLENDVEYFLDNYNLFFKGELNNPYIYEDDGFIQSRAKELGFIFGPVFYLIRPRFHFHIKLNWGLVYLKKHQMGFVAKEINSNQKQKILIETVKNKSPVFFPEFKFEYTLLKGENLSLGIQAHGNLFYQDKIMNYKLVLYNWTIDNSSTLKVEKPRHRFIKYELGTGLVFTW